MHILLIHQAFAALDDPGGTRHHELARHLVGFGHKVTIIASPVSYLTGTAKARVGWKNRQVDDRGVEIIRAYTLPALHRSFVWRVFSFLSFMVSSFLIGLSVKKVDLVWGTTPPLFQGVTAWLLARLKRVPFLFEVRDLWPAFAIAVGVLKNHTLIRLSEWLEKFIYQRADHIVVNSPGFIEHVKLRGGKKIDLIPNGADPEMFNPLLSGEEFRTKNNLGRDFIVMYAGAHGLSNDLGIVLEAAELLKVEKVLRFVLVGDGKDKPALIEKAKQRNLANVLFLPPAPKNEMPQVLAGANACLAILKPIDLYKTTYPNKVFDYMAAGKAVLLAIDGVIRDLVEEAGAGVFVQPGDPKALAAAAKELMENPSAAEMMGKAGRLFIEGKFSRSQIASQFNMLLESVWRKNG